MGWLAGWYDLLDVKLSREALELVGIMESDTEILDRLFSMFDKTGNDQINYKEFVGGLAPLCHGSVEEKLACKQNIMFCETGLDGHVKVYLCLFWHCGLYGIIYILRAIVTKTDL